MDRIMLVSADGHATAPPETFRPYLERKYHPLLERLEEENRQFTSFSDIISTMPPAVLEIIDGDQAISSGGLLGSWDVDRRLAEMDREGVVTEMLIYGTQLATTPFFGAGNRPYPPDVRAAGARAYHRWLADCMARADGRLFAVADPGPTLDMDATIEELRWVADHGFRSVAVPGIVADPSLPPLHDAYYEPFWRTCAELGILLSVHAGHGLAQGHFLEFVDRATRGRSTQQEILEYVVSGVDGSPFELGMIPQRVLWSLMLAGAFDRYPDLQLALTEVRGDWVPATLAILDARFEAGDTPLRKRPSEYWQSNCWSAASSIKQSEVRLREQIGIDRMMFGRDYPHPEGTWPNTWDWLRDALAGVPEDQARKILGENAVRCYGLDERKLRALAAKIGPKPEDILTGAESVDPRMVDHFDQRGGYRKSMEDVDADEVRQLFDEDLAAVGSR